MKRRSFLKILAGAACAVAVGIELALPNDTKAEIDVRPPTPTWLNAPYEVGFLFHKDAFKRMEPRGGIDPQTLVQHTINSLVAFPEPDYDALDEERYNEYLREA